MSKSKTIKETDYHKLVAFDSPRGTIYQIWSKNPSTLIRAAIPSRAEALFWQWEECVILDNLRKAEEENND